MAQVAWWCHSWTAGIKADLGKDDELGLNSKCSFRKNNSLGLRLLSFSMLLSLQTNTAKVMH